MSRWWRAYDDALNDPKLQRLGLEMVGAWFNLLCIASANGGVIKVADVPFALRLSNTRVAAIIARLASAGLLDRVGDDYTPHNWTSRQYQSDVTDPTNAARQKRYRQRHAVTDGAATPTVTDTVTQTVTVKRPETEADTEQKESSLREEARKRATRLTTDWWPSTENVDYAIAKGLSLDRINTEAERFRNYWTAKGGKDAAKLDWDATWNNWILRAMETPNGSAKTGNDRGQNRLAALCTDLADEARRRERAAGLGRPDDAFGGY